MGHVRSHGCRDLLVYCTSMALACWQKAADGDVAAQSFIRDTMDGKPIQRSDISIAQQHRNSEELSDEELAARIAELEAEAVIEAIASPPNARPPHESAPHRR